MKIRQDFVTNSSSSSFVVFFDKKPKIAKEIISMLKWNKRDPCWKKHKTNHEEVSRILLRDINDTSGHWMIEDGNNEYGDRKTTKKERLLYLIGSAVIEFSSNKKQCVNGIVHFNVAGVNFKIPFVNTRNIPLENLPSHCSKILKDNKRTIHKIHNHIMKENDGKFLFIKDYNNFDDKKDTILKSGSPFKNVFHLKLPCSYTEHQQCLPH